MLQEDGTADGGRADFGRASFRAKFTALDPEAAEFLKARIDWEARNLRLLRVAGCLLLGAQIVGSWAYFLASGAPYRLGARLFVSLLFPFGVFLIALLPFYFWIRKVKLPRFRRDLEGGVLAVADRVPFCIGGLNTAGKGHYSVIVDDVKITAPLCSPLDRNIPQSGQGTFQYFPNTLLCWTYDGKCLWKRGAFRFW